MLDLRFWLCLCAFGVCGLSIANPSAAQSHRPRADSIHHRNDCRLAVQVLTHGQPANKRSWALARAPECGPQGGRAMAAELERHRRQATTTGELEAVAYAAAWMWDASVYATALSIAEDRRAGVAARVNAIRVLHGQVEPGAVMSYQHYVTVRPNTYTMSTGSPAVGSVLPTDAAQQIQSRLRAVEANESTPHDVRVAAGRVAAAVRGFLHFRSICPAGTPSPECSRRMAERQRQPQP